MNIWVVDHLELLMIAEDTLYIASTKGLQIFRALYTPRVKISDPADTWHTVGPQKTPGITARHRTHKWILPLLEAELQRQALSLL